MVFHFVDTIAQLTFDDYADIFYNYAVVAIFQIGSTRVISSVVWIDKVQRQTSIILQIKIQLNFIVEQEQSVFFIRPI